MAVQATLIPMIADSESCRAAADALEASLSMMPETMPIGDTDEVGLGDGEQVRLSVEEVDAVRLGSEDQ